MKQKRNTLAFADYMKEKLSDPEYLERYIEIAIEDFLKDRDIIGFLCALRTVADARGGIPKLAKKAGLSKQALYKIFSPKGNPEFSTIVNIMDKMGMKLSVSVK